MSPPQHISRPDPAPVVESQQRQLRRAATAHYWEVAVAGLHKVRFQSPSGDVSADKYYRAYVKRFRKAMARAKSAMVTDVDQDVQTLSQRHLEWDEELLRLFDEVASYNTRHQVPKDQTPVGQQFELAQTLFSRLQTDPALFDKLTDPELRSICERAIGLQTRVLEQYRQIEIMQAVLKERYPGCDFALPEIEQ